MTSPDSLPLTKEQIEMLWLVWAGGAPHLDSDELRQLCDQALAALAYKSRAEAAEKRVAELEKLLRGLPIMALPEYVIKDIDAALEKK